MRLAFSLLLLFAPFCVWAGDLVIVRHGNSQHNLSHEYNSNPYHPNYRVSCLTPLGVKQAVATAKALLAAGYNNENIAQVLVSPLPRTRQTAQVLIEQGLFSADKIQVDERLIEVRAGDREGLSLDIFNEDPWERPDAHDYSGETNADVLERTLTLYRESAGAFSQGDKHVLYITHGMPAYELISHIKGEQIRLRTSESFILPLNTYELSTG